MFRILFCACLVLLAQANAAESGGAVHGLIKVGLAKHKANAIIYVKQGDKGLPESKTVLMDQRGMVFVPRVLPIRLGWTVEFKNSDPVGHNVFTLDGEKYDLGTWPKGQTRKYTFAKPGTYRQLCRVHDDMIAFIVVLDTNRFALSDKQGAFALSDLPPGDYTLAVWHEKLAAEDIKVQILAGQTVQIEVPLIAPK